VLVKWSTHSNWREGESNNSFAITVSRHPPYPKMPPHITGNNFPFLPTSLNNLPHTTDTYTTINDNTATCLLPENTVT